MLQAATQREGIVNKLGQIIPFREIYRKVSFSTPP